MSDAMAIDAGLKPEVMHAEIGQHAHRGKGEPAAYLDKREQSGGNHLGRHHHIGPESQQTRVQPPREMSPTPCDEGVPCPDTAHAAHARRLPKRRAKQAKQNPINWRITAAIGTWQRLTDACGSEKFYALGKGRRQRLVALQDPPPSTLLELEDAVVELRTLMHQPQVGLPHGLGGAFVHQRLEVER
jgi:hypothetical protein